jgi:NAD(P)-dependent dehydrogenase (short-subunit alcohol dehydrogenase family)
MGLLEGDTALITGAASGIGRGIAKVLAGEGARLVLSDIAEQPGQALARELNATFVTADLADPAAAHKLFETAEKTVGAISILVHSASPKRHESQTALAVTEAEWDSMITVGLRAGFVLGQAAGARMKARRIKGRMLFITSPHAQTPRNLPHYSATKAGQTMLVKELARALGADGIRVNAIAPGAVPGGGFDADTATLSKMIALGRAGTPEDIANMAVALLCDRFSRYVTGTTVVVDGGLSLYNWIPARS